MFPMGLLPKKTTPGVTSPQYGDRKKNIQDKAMGDLAALDDPNSNFQKGYSDREQNLTQQYASIRTGLQAGKEAMGQDMGRALARQQAAGGGAGGGAMAKLRTQGMSELAKQVGTVEAGVGAEEAAAREGLSGAKASERFAREEAIRAGQQFSETLAFQEGSFADQMKFTWAEFDENLKTNLVNTAALLRESGLDNPGRRQGVYDALIELYGPARTPDWRRRKQSAYVYA